MKNKYRIQRVLWDEDCNIIPVQDRSHKNSPISTPSPRTESIRKLYYQDSHINDEPTLEKTPEVSLKNVSSNIKNYFKSLIKINIDLELQNRTLKEELLHKQRFIADLQRKYDDCVDVIVTLSDTIHRSETGHVETRYSHEFKAERKENNRLKGNIRQVEEEHKLRRAKAKILDIDIDGFKKKMENLREDTVMLTREDRILYSKVIDADTNIKEVKRKGHKGHPSDTIESGDSSTLKKREHHQY